MSTVPAGWIVLTCGEVVYVPMPNSHRLDPSDPLWLRAKDVRGIVDRAPEMGGGSSVLVKGNRTYIVVESPHEVAAKVTQAGGNEPAP